METLFAFDKRNYQDCQSAYRGERNREYYTGDYSIDAGSVIDVRAERKVVGSISIIRTRARTRQTFRRSWSHIREDGTDVAVLWFVRRGRLCVSDARGEVVGMPGDFMVTQSMTPFSVECLTGDDGVHEVLHLIVPTHALRRLLCHDVRTGFRVAAGSREVAAAERILADVFEDPGEMKASTSGLLVDTALSVLGEAIKDHQAGAPRRQSLSDKRLADVLRYLDLHLGDPRLTISMVAEGCGISTRYLSLLLKHNGTPFSTLIWDKRLKTAGQWLSASRPAEASISEIAYRVGFKSPAHFSRMFKRQFKVSPRNYRARGIAPPALETQALVADGGQSRH